MRFKNCSKAILAMLIVCMSSTALAQKSSQELLQEIETRNRATQLQMEELQLKRQQIEIETTRRYIEIERLNAETGRLRMWNESQDAADRARKIADLAERAASERAQAEKRAEEAAAALQDEIARAAVRTKNNFYLVVLLLFTIGSVIYIIRKSNKEKIMQQNQKFGIVVIIVSVLVILLALMISDNWWEKSDFLQNLISNLRINLFADEIKRHEYLIEVPTKYVVFTCLCAAAYGLTTYLGITPVPRKKGPTPQSTNIDETL